ncbi:hypothetical protein [Duganella sp. Dugasp56]|uniref:hypothetical protein n=1 Tax=Duganella sp. Dugasp56 TaxID=3243046 RepID=UPI0039B11144
MVTKFRFDLTGRELFDDEKVLVTVFSTARDRGIVGPKTEADEDVVRQSVVNGTPRRTLFAAFVTQTQKELTAALTTGKATKGRLRVQAAPTAKAVGKVVAKHLTKSNSKATTKPKVQEVGKPLAQPAKPRGQSTPKQKIDKSLEMACTL